MDKDPDATLDFTVDWTAWLAKDDDTADSFSWLVPEDLVSERETSDGGKATIWLSGGREGAAYAVVCRITTAAGRVDDRSIPVWIRSR